MTLKEQIHNHCRQVVTDKLSMLRQKQQDLMESIAGETKSSVGDKYETSRAMLHIEQEQLARQVAELTAQLVLFNTIDPTAQTQRAALGSLLHIGDTYYYLSIGLGKMQVAGHAVIALSLQSPLGGKLKGLGTGVVIEVNGKGQVVSEVL